MATPTAALTRPVGPACRAATALELRAGPHPAHGVAFAVSVAARRQQRDESRPPPQTDYPPCLLFETRSRSRGPLRRRRTTSRCGRLRVGRAQTPRWLLVEQLRPVPLFVVARDPSLLPCAPCLWSLCQT